MQRILQNNTNVTGEIADFVAFTEKRDEIGKISAETFNKVFDYYVNISFLTTCFDHEKV